MSYSPLSPFQDLLNSTTTPLAAGATFTGTWVQSSMPLIMFQAKADSDYTVYFDFSIDGSNADSTYPVAGYSASANVPEVHTAKVDGRYYRVRVVNGTTPMTYLRMGVYQSNDGLLRAAMNQPLNRDDDAIATRPTRLEDEILLSLRNRASQLAYRGRRTGATSGAGDEVIWGSTSATYTPMTSADTFDISYNNATDGNGTTGALSLLFRYIDANGELATAVHVLGGTGTDTTSFSGFGINEILVYSVGSAGTNTSAIEVTDTSGATVQAHIPALHGITYQMLCHVPSNGKSIVTKFRVSTSKTGGGGNPKVRFKAYVYLRSLGVTIVAFDETIDTQSGTAIDINESALLLTAGSAAWVTMDTDTNNTDGSGRFTLRTYLDN